MDEPDLTLLRTWGSDLIEPPSGLQSRIEEQLWQAILAEEQTRAGATRRPSAGSRGMRRWFDGLLRPAVAAGAAALLAIGVAIASDGSSAPVTGSDASVRQASAGVFDSAATALFGEASPAPGGISGRIDLRSFDENHQPLINGPVRNEVSGELDEPSSAFTRDAPRDPTELRAALRLAATEMAGSDPTDRVAFHLAMQWVVADDVPADLRAAMLRSLDGLTGLDPAQRSVDVLGRSGLAIGHVDPSSGLREQYLLRIDDATLLERRAFTTTYVIPACPLYTVTDHALFDDDGHKIDRTSAPWLAWPSVVDACAPGTISS